MNINTTRRVALAANAILLLGFGGVAHGLWSDKHVAARNRLAWQQEIASALFDVRPRAREDAAPVRYEEIRKNPLCTPPVKAPPPPPPPPPPPAGRPLGDLVQVMCIIGHQDLDGQEAVAYLLPKPTPKKGEGPAIRFFAQGQELPFVEGAHVARIEDTSVVFVHRGREVRLLVDAHAVNPVAGSRRPTTRAVAKAPISRDAATWLEVKPSSDRIRITAVGLSSIQALGDDALAGVRMKTTTLPRRGAALQFEHIPSSNVLARAGLRSKDALASINDVPIRSRGDIRRYLENNPGVPEFRVSIFRNGRLIERVVTRR